MLRSLFLWLSARQSVFTFAKHNKLANKIASRFVAGESVTTAVEAARALNAKGITVSLDLLGESVTVADEAVGARDGVLEALQAIAQAEIAGNVSVKLTQMGLDIDEALCGANMRAILTRARELDTFVRIDMEASAYVERTLRLFREQLFPTFGDLVGVVIQSYLRRSADDVEALVGMGARVRLCKGAYAEPAAVAFHGKKAVNASYLALMKRLLDDGNYPAIATHDSELINQAVRYAQTQHIPPARFEFQMLYGVRRDLQERLRAQGYNVRVYIPFGNNWYPYLMRRLGERPGNVTFMIASVVKESLSRP